MANTRTQRRENELPYIPFGPFQIRLPFIHYKIESVEFIQGLILGVTALTDGKDAAIIVCGQLVATALQAAEELKEEGINVSVVDMFTIKPLDTEMIETVAKECGCILTLEEHSIYGGLGGAVAEVAAQTEMVPLDICGIPDEDVPNGTDQEVFKYYKMDVQGIKDRVKILISKKSK